MPFCNVCNKENTSEDLSTIGNQYVCCLSCVGLLKANEKDACTNCGRPVWKDNYYEIRNLYFCSEKCKNIIQEKLIKEKGGKYAKCRHFKEEKYINTSPKNNDNKSNDSLIDDSFKVSIINVKEDDKQPNYNNQEIDPFETDKNMNDIMEDSDWNKNSFIQKEQEQEQEQDISIENINHKENMKILYRIEKSIHSKQIYQTEDPFNFQKKENVNFIKNIRKYFIEDKDNYHNHHHNFKNNYQKSRKRIDNNYNLLTKKSEYKENHKISTKNYPIHSNFLSSNTIEIIKEKHFVNNDNNNDFNEKNRSNSLSNIRRLNAIDNKSYYFNPIRKTENLNATKKDSFPLDSFSYPVDSLPRKTEKDRNSSINCCANCRKPIIMRNSNVHKDFCSLSCRNLYFKS